MKIEQTPSTLSEILIILAIICLFAAITIPVLTADYRKKREIEVKLEKIYSVMNKAIDKTIAKNGDYQNWVINCATPACSVKDTVKWYKKYIGKHIKSRRIKPAKNGSGFLVPFRDGGILYIEYLGNNLYDMKFCINAKALDNPVGGLNSFVFTFDPAKNSGDERGFEPFTWLWDGTKEDLINSRHANASWGCRTDAANKLYCTKLIQLNGWKIPDDYPFKF